MPCPRGPALFLLAPHHAHAPPELRVCSVFELIDQPDCVSRRLNFLIVIEVAIDISAVAFACSFIQYPIGVFGLAACLPQLDAGGPATDGFV